MLFSRKNRRNQHEIEISYCYRDRPGARVASCYGDGSKRGFEHGAQRSLRDEQGRGRRVRGRFAWHRGAGEISRSFRLEAASPSPLSPQAVLISTNPMSAALVSAGAGLLGLSRSTAAPMLGQATSLHQDAARMLRKSSSPQGRQRRRRG